MKTTHLAISLGIVAWIAVTANAETLRVPDRYPTIQSAIDAAADGDLVLVEPGTYRERIDLSGKSISVIAPGGPTTTTIDAEGLGTTVRILGNEDSSTVLSGFTITGGDIEAGEVYGGSGIRCSWTSYPLIIGNIIRDNRGYTAGGIDAGSAWIAGNRIEHNTALTNHNDSGGGGIRCHFGTPMIVGNEIVGNTADNGGGIWVNGARPVIVGNLIADNAVHTSGDFADGIFVYYVRGGALEIRDNILRGHETAIHARVVEADLRIEANRISDGMVELRDCFGITLVNNVHRSGHLCVSNSPDCRLVHETLLDTPVTLTGTALTAVNTIIWSETPGPIELIDGADLLASYCDIRGGWPGEGNFDADPLLVASPDGYLRLRIESPCVDAGTQIPSEIAPADAESDPRPLPGVPFGTPRVDVGSDEMQVGLAVRLGSVGSARRSIDGPDQVVLVNGSAGDATRREVILDGSQAATVDVLVPQSGPASAPFAIYAYSGEPDGISAIQQPAGLGWMSFGTPLRQHHAPPYLRIWNNIGRFPRLGFPHAASVPAPSRLLRIPPNRLTAGTVITFQGFILDDASDSSFAASVTNAVVLRVE